MPLVLVCRDNKIATVTFNRPEAMNALSRQLRLEFAAVMRDLAGDPDVHAIILTGAGDRAFTAGLDLKELGSDTSNLEAASSDADDNPVKAIENCPQPVIGAINGVAVTGGFEVALACDILLASTNARFADTHARVGILPGWGLSQKLSRRIGLSRAKELSLTGNFIDATTACAWGLVNRVVSPESLLDTATTLASDIAGIDPVMVQAYRSMIDDGFAIGLRDALLLEHERSSSANRAVRAEDVEKRRLNVMERGRSAS